MEARVLSGSLDKTRTKDTVWGICTVMGGQDWRIHGQCLCGHEEASDQGSEQGLPPDISTEPREIGAEAAVISDSVIWLPKLGLQICFRPRLCLPAILCDDPDLKS